MSGLRSVLLGLVFGGGFLGQNLSGQLAQTVFVRPSVVPAEEELAPRRKDSSYPGGSTAAITTVGGGQIGAGERSSHVDLPPSRHRSPGACWPRPRWRSSPRARDSYSCRRFGPRKCSRADAIVITVGSTRMSQSETGNSSRCVTVTCGFVRNGVRISVTGATISTGGSLVRCPRTGPVSGVSPRLRGARRPHLGW
jgi:hypothetical protein